MMVVLTACSGDLVVKPIYNHANGRVVVELSDDIDGKTLYVRVRRGHFGTLDCSKLRSEIDPIANASGSRVDGPLIDPALTQPFYGPEWGNGDPTPEMIAAAQAGTDSIIDVCLYDGSDLAAHVERDLFQAWDDGRKEGLGGKADDPNSGEVTINSPQAYGERCVAELGEIPFFEKTGDGTYSTYDCLDSTPIPMTITNADGVVQAPQAGTVSQCDNPQYIYSLCEAGPRVAERTNDKGTRWVLLCRKSIGGFSSNQFNDIAMIGHNPFTGKTCFFQNALYTKTDGGHVPHPADKDKSTNLWSGVHGGLGSGIECNRCHDSDPFIHSPWIDGARDAQQRPIVPKMGIDPDLALGANDTPYSIVNLAGQHWKQEAQLVSAEANACLRCHRIGAGEWATGYITRLEGKDSSWTGITSAVYNQPAHKYWMPPDTSFPTEDAWVQSEFSRAAAFIQSCGSNPSSCQWQDIPHAPGDGSSGGKLRNPVNLADGELARQATTILGMNKDAPSQECAECHAPTQTTLHDWADKSEGALANCLSATDGGTPRDDKVTDAHVGQGEFKTYGPFEVASGALIEVHMTGSGDADLYVKRGEMVSTDVYDCRPYGNGSQEDCTPMQFNASGPATFWVGVNGFAESTISLEIKYNAPSDAQRPPKEVVDCLRLDPGHADSPFTPAKLGIYAAAAHLGWFQDVFKAAFPAGSDGNDVDTWAIEYGKFKSRVAMPKGNHPRLTQPQFDIVAEWFARGMPQLASYIAVDNGPASCVASIGTAVSGHATQMATQGWRAVNRDAGLLMYGCGGADDPLGCLASLPDATATGYGAGWASFGTLRVLRALSFNTFFWMRSSPDGRFIANGATSGDGAMISDLQANKDIGVKAAYDPGFFPDNRGWVFQGTPIGAGFCTMNLLTSDPDHITFSEPQCGAVDTVSLYQHLGAGLGGGDYFVINSQFSSDHPGGAMTTDPAAEFSSTAEIRLSPMVFDGTHYVAKTSVSTASPFEGDSVLSPSTTLIVSRFGNAGGQLGYVLRRLDATPSGTSYAVSTPEIARYCVQGGKPAISFDERFMVFHHYVGPADYADLGFASASDPAFADMLAKGTSNIVVLDLVTGARKRVTAMHAGQYALYPHFRSDGWIYFLVRDQTTGHEFAVASDAALRM